MKLLDGLVSIVAPRVAVIKHSFGQWLLVSRIAVTIEPQSGIKKIHWNFGMALGAFTLVGWNVFAQQTVQVVAPRKAATILDGNSYATPFDMAGRFQQVYDASIFSSSFQLTGGRGFIRFIGFGIDGNVGHSFHSTLPSVQLNLSTTTKPADGLSSVFAENVGSDDVAVLGPESILFSVLGGGGIRTFSMWFDFSDKPYYYDSTKGNLLVDFRINEGFVPSSPTLGVAILDSFTDIGDSISSIYANGPSSATSGQISTLGLATDFIFDAIPKMNISVESTNVQIRWLISSRGDYQLEQTSGLGVDARWQPFAGTVVTNLSQNLASVTLPLEAVTGRFFRLAWQTSSSNAAGFGPNLEPVSLITVPPQ